MFRRFTLLMHLRMETAVGERRSVQDQKERCSTFFIHHLTRVNEKAANDPASFVLITFSAGERICNQECGKVKRPSRLPIDSTSSATLKVRHVTCPFTHTQHTTAWWMHHRTASILSNFSASTSKNNANSKSFLRESALRPSAIMTQERVH